MDSPLPPLAQQAEEFHRQLRRWYGRHRRQLPWREHPSLYGTVVSEFMLQQTQVKTVLPYFDRWLRLFPSFEALARAPESEVVKAWEGLGYYSRARNLHRLAQAYIAAAHPPRTSEEWQELPGIGPYTAAAITSIALDQPNACVDGNVVRILARLTGDAREFRDSASASAAFTGLAAALLDHKHPGDHNQAMMELGATVCHRQSPLCTVCPVLTFCVAGKNGEAESLPRLAPKKTELKAVARLWCLEGERLLLHRTPATAKRLANLCELPDATDLGLTSSELASLPLLATKKRAITRYQITESIYAIEPGRLKIPAAKASDFIWASRESLARLTLSGPHRRWVSALLEATRS